MAIIKGLLDKALIIYVPESYFESFVFDHEHQSTCKVRIENSWPKDWRQEIKPKENR